MTSTSEKRADNESEDDEKYSRPSTPSDQHDTLLDKADDRSARINHVSSKFVKIHFYLHLKNKRFCFMNIRILKAIL